MLALKLLLVPGFLTSIYLDLSLAENASAVDLAASLFVIAAVFQIVDGTQVTTQGALRGLKEVAH